MNVETYLVCPEDRATAIMIAVNEQGEGLSEAETLLVVRAALPGVSARECSTLIEEVRGLLEEAARFDLDGPGAVALWNIQAGESWPVCWDSADELRDRFRANARGEATRMVANVGGAGAVVTHLALLGVVPSVSAAAS